MNKNILRNLDLLLLTPVIILVILSIVTLFSLNINFFYGQSALFLLSFVIFLIISQTNYLVFKIYAKHIYILSIIILFFVLLIGIESKGAVRWVEILGFRLQFSEVLKPILSISLASYLSSLKTLNLKNFINTFLLLSPIAVLIFLQPDLGNAIIYFLIVLLTVVYLGFPLRYFIVSFLPFLLATPFLWRFLHDYQKQRILTFINPSIDPLGTSYNVIQSIIAVGSGMLMGKGIGQGTQSSLKFLPERQTDFIFATISEQLGFIGVLIILVCFSIMLYRILQIVFNTNDNFSKILSVIIFFTFLIQIFINISMNLGLLPIVGVTLPFISYGGSSLFVSMMAVGILINIAKDKK